MKARMVRRVKGYARKDSMTLTIDLPEEKTAALTARAKAQGLSAEQYARKVLEHELEVGTTEGLKAPELPVWRLGAKGSVRRREIYDDVS